MARIEIRPAVAEDVETVAERMRDADRVEVWAASLSTPRNALDRAMRQSDRAWSVTIDGRPEAMFGAAALSALSGQGTAWMLGTPEIARFPRRMIEDARPMVAAMLELYPVLINYVDARNAASLRWLRRLGARFEPPRPWGALGLPFVPFAIERSPAHV